MNLNNVSLIKIGNGSEVSFMKLNGVIVYEKSTTPLYKDREFFFNETITEVETRINSTHTSLNSMFIQCFNLQTVNITGWNKNNGRVTDMYMMFYLCRSLTTVNTIDFNTSGVENMASMFEGCSSLTTLDLSSFDTSNVTNMGRMFNGCNLLHTLNLSNFDISRVTAMNMMFSDCNYLKTLRLDNCDTATISKIMTASSLPSGKTPFGQTRYFYCKEENLTGATYHGDWQPIFI